VRRWFVAVGFLLLVGACAKADDDNQMMNVDVNAAVSDQTANSPAKNETAQERKKRLRQKAKTDPEGADAEAISHMSREEVVATAINSAGFLCARVTSMNMVGGTMYVDCIEYRNGEGRVSYSIDPNSGTVEQR
jgi:hypothetical protein